MCESVALVHGLGSLWGFGIGGSARDAGLRSKIGGLGISDLHPKKAKVYAEARDGKSRILPPKPQTLNPKP